MREKKVKKRSNEDKLSFQMVAGIGRRKKRSIMLQIFFYTASWLGGKARNFKIHHPVTDDDLKAFPGISA
jgi:hypothetical protein